MYCTEPLPDCDDLENVHRSYNSTSAGLQQCLLDRRRDIAARIYLSVAIFNGVFVVITTLLFIYCAQKPMPSPQTALSNGPNLVQLKRIWKQNSLKKRCAFATSLSAAGHLIFTTCIFLTQAFNDTLRCQLLLWGVVIGLYTWVSALCIRAYRLWFLFRLNQLKVKYLRMTSAERATCINEKDYRWYLTSCRIKRYKLIRPYIIYILLLCITITIVIPAEVSAIRSFGTCNIYWGGGALVGYYGGFIVIVAPIILWKLRNNSDAHGIRTEIWIDIIIGIPFFLLFTMWFSFNLTNHSIFSFYAHILFDPDKWAAFFTIIAHVISVVIPVIQFLLVENKCWSRLQSRLEKIRNSITKAIFLKTSTVQSTRAQIEEEAVLHSIFSTQLQPELSIESLERTLTDPEMLNQLQDLAIRDFSSENILFYSIYLRLEERFKNELIISNSSELRQPMSNYTNTTRNWITSLAKKSPMKPFMTTSSLNIEPSEDNDDEQGLSLERYLSIPIPYKMYPDFIRFYESFIREGSCNQVNISHRARHEIDEAFSTIYQKHPEFNSIRCNYCNIPINTSSSIRSEEAGDNDGEDERNTDTQAKKYSNSANQINMKHRSLAVILNFNMFQAARIEVCWNIFNSVYPKFVETHNRIHRSTIRNNP